MKALNGFERRLDIFLHHQPLPSTGMSHCFTKGWREDKPFLLLSPRSISNSCSLLWGIQFFSERHHIYESTKISQEHVQELKHSYSLEATTFTLNPKMHPPVLMAIPLTSLLHCQAWTNTTHAILYGICLIMMINGSNIAQSFALLFFLLLQSVLSVFTNRVV